MNSMKPVSVGLVAEHAASKGCSLERSDSVDNSLLNHSMIVVHITSFEVSGEASDHSILVETARL